MKFPKTFIVLVACLLGLGGYLGYRFFALKSISEPSAEGVGETLRAERPAAAPVIQSPELAMLNDASRPPLEDVRLLGGLVVDYLLLVKDKRRPIGLNEDVVIALTEAGRFGVRFMSPTHPAISEGVLLDRWGEPFHFHALSADEFEVRSAGPDRILFTVDDLVCGGEESTFP